MASPAPPPQPQQQQQETGSAPSLATLGAVRQLAAGVRGRPPFSLTPECLAAAEELVGTAGKRTAAAGGGRGGADHHGARLVLQWVVGVLVAPSQQGKKDGGGEAAGGVSKATGPVPATTATTAAAMQEARVWRACGRALTPMAIPKGGAAHHHQQQQQQQQQQPSLATTLPQASALGLFQAAAAAVFGADTPPEAAEAAVRAVAALTGLPYPPLESWTLCVCSRIISLVMAASICLFTTQSTTGPISPSHRHTHIHALTHKRRASINTVGLPQVPADRALELVATDVIDRLHTRPNAPGGAALGALALQYLTLVQAQQAVCAPWGLLFDP
jgi:hypothetical protein